MAEVTLGQRNPKIRRCAWEGEDAEAMINDDGEFIQECLPPAYIQYRDSLVAEQEEKRKKKVSKKARVEAPTMALRSSGSVNQ
jgi:hypothetical protein